MKEKNFRYLKLLLTCDDFEIFKSNICHFLKELKDAPFMEMVINEYWVETFFKQGKVFEALYTMAMMDYLAEEHKLEPYPEYEAFRSQKLAWPLFPRSLEFLNEFSGENELEKALEKCKKHPCGKHFIKYNIVEGDIRDVR